MPLEILETDRWFPITEAPGNPDCICSRCGRLIETDDTPIQIWLEEEDLYARFHPECLGFQTSPSDINLDDLQEP